MNTLQGLSVTRTTYRVADFLSWQRGGNLNLRPLFQRNSVWSSKAKSFFLDSVVRGFPVPLVFIQDQTDEKTYEPKRIVIDGQQRIRTLLAYVDPRCLRDREPSDDFKVLAMHNEDLAGKNFAQLPEELRERILNFQFSVHVLPSTTSHSVLLELFARMNSTGLKLNAQELRNAEFSGAFKQASSSLAFAHVEDWRSLGIFSDAQLARMAEVEFVSELLMMMSQGIQAKSQPAIDKWYEKFEESYSDKRATSKRFEHVFDLVRDAYLEAGRVDVKAAGVFKSQSWFYAVFALAVELCYGRDTKGAQRAIERRAFAKHLLRRANALLAGKADTELLKALRGASADKASRMERLRYLHQGWTRG